MRGLDLELLLPMQHAWLVDADNKIIDPTWNDGGLTICISGSDELRAQPAADQEERRHTG